MVKTNSRKYCTAYFHQILSVLHQRIADLLNIHGFHFRRCWIIHITVYYIFTIDLYLSIGWAWLRTYCMCAVLTDYPMEAGATSSSSPSTTLHFLNVKYKQTDMVEQSYAASCKVSSLLEVQIAHHSHFQLAETSEKQREWKKANNQEKSQSTADEAERLLEELPCISARAVDEVGSWKESFQVVVSSANWGAWVLPSQDCLSWCNLPEVRMDAWLATGKMYLWKPVQRGTCIHMFTWRVQVLRHNEIRDLTAKLFTEVCPNVRIEPEPQPLTGESLLYTSTNRQDSARLDICAQDYLGEWQQDAFFDVRVFNPHTSSNYQPSPEVCYRKHENEKRRAYDQWVKEIEQGTYASLMFYATRGMGPAARTVYKRLASLISEKTGQPYSIAMWWIQCRLSFALLRSAILCIQGSWTSYHQLICSYEVPIVVISSESRVLTSW